MSRLDERIQRAVTGVAAFADLLPAVTIIHRCADFTVEWMSARGLAILGLTLDELRALGPEYYARYFHPEDAAEYVPRLFEMMQRRRDEDLVAFFHQVRPTPDAEWTWYAAATRVLLRDDADLPVLTLSLILPIDEQHHLTAKIVRLTEEKLFIRRHADAFNRLTPRERAVLRLMALGKTAGEIARELAMSTATAETHRRNIKKKLQARSAYDLSQYARAFDLI